RFFEHLSVEHGPRGVESRGDQVPVEGQLHAPAALGCGAQFARWQPPCATRYPEGGNRRAFSAADEREVATTRAEPSAQRSRRGISGRFAQSVYGEFARQTGRV